MVDCTGGGTVELFHNGSKKLETSSAGGTLHGTWTGVGSRTLLSTTSLSGSTTTVNVTVTGYHALEGSIMNLDTTGTATNDYRIRFNGDNNDNYKFIRITQDHPSSPTRSVNGSNADSGFPVNFAGTTSLKDGDNYGNFKIWNVNETNLRNAFEMSSGSPDPGGNGDICIFMSGFWDNPDKITSVTIACSNTMNGGSLVLWGIK